MKKRMLTMLIVVSYLFSFQTSFATQSNDAIIESKSKTVELLDVETESLSDDLDKSEISSGGKFTIDEKFQKSFINTKSITAAVSGPDLTIGNLNVVTSKTPFPYNEDVTFEMLVANIGTQSISNVRVQTYVDNNIVVNDSIGTLAANKGGTYSVPLRNLCGTHTIKFTISSTESETTTSNNSISNQFTWENAVDLAVYSFISEEGSTFESCKHNDNEKEPSDVTREFTLKVANYGNVSANNVKVNLMMGSSSIGTITADFSARTVKSFTLNYAIYKANNQLKLSAIIDPNNQTNDAKTENNTATRTFKVTYDTERWAGYFKNSKNINVQIFPAVEDYIINQSDSITSSELTSAIKQWNGISSAVSFHSFTYADEDHDDFDIALDVAKLPRGVLGATFLYKQSGDLLVDIDDVINDSSPYIKSIIYLSPTLIDYNTDIQKTTVIHEFGHALGLKHTFCDDKSIMKASVTSLLSATSVQEHDKYNIKQIY
ncbi:CARDB domain-containing protein [Clostridium minihomine]|uniref:CARDB domain-containing protein n=1 Tax=Clostridium minihomine TaxID=2045012 RepID=UPI000C75F86D|nr:CARDB domain-containing protein [Clostridium minihomine]